MSDSSPPDAPPPDESPAGTPPPDDGGSTEAGTGTPPAEEPAAETPPAEEPAAAAPAEEPAAETPPAEGPAAETPPAEEPAAAAAPPEEPAAAEPPPPEEPAAALPPSEEPAADASQTEEAPAVAPPPDADVTAEAPVTAGAWAAREAPPPEELRAEAAPRARGTGPLRLLAWAVVLGGLILMAAGAFTWYVVRDQLSDEQITVSDDADRFAGDPVDNPWTAYEQADVINKHALEASDGLTYAQLDQDDPRRDTVMTASFLRASLYTSVVSFGVAVFAFGLGLLMIIIGWALLRINRSLRAQRA
ncbi:MAG TPA: hypothetical protein VKD21_18420 [Acidimicrobiales bacterium]|nr:hypothetical protein [Acidimicrobiales bacterium]